MSAPLQTHSSAAPTPRERHTRPFEAVTLPNRPLNEVLESTTAGSDASRRAITVRLVCPTRECVADHAMSADEEPVSLPSIERLEARSRDGDPEIAALIDVGTVGSPMAYRFVAPRRDGRRRQ